MKITPELVINVLTSAAQAMPAAVALADAAIGTMNAVDAQKVREARDAALAQAAQDHARIQSMD